MSPTALRRKAPTFRFVCAATLFYFVLGLHTSGESLIDKLADGKIRDSSTPGLRVAYLPIIFPSSHASNLLSLSNGDLLCAYYSGRWEAQSGVAIVLSRLPKGSDQWTRPVVVAQEAGSAFENPVLFESPGRLLWLFYTSQAADAGQSNAQIFSRTSTDGGKNWTAAKLLFSKPGSFDREHLLDAGDRWFFPIYYTPHSDAENYSAIEISADQGHNWKECAVPGSNGLVQPDVVELSPRRFMALFRSRFADWVYTSSSEDGCSWSAPRPTQIPNNNSSIQVTRLGDGHLVIAFNNIQATTTRGKPRDWLDGRCLSGSRLMAAKLGRGYATSTSGRTSLRRRCRTLWLGPMSATRRKPSSSTSSTTRTLPLLKLQTAGSTCRTPTDGERSNARFLMRAGSRVAPH